MRHAVKEAARKNLHHFLKAGPGLSYGYSQYVIARDSKAGMILIGGLGGMGIGQVWYREGELSYQNQLAGVNEAPDVPWNEGLTVWDFWRGRLFVPDPLDSPRWNCWAD